MHEVKRPKLGPPGSFTAPRPGVPIDLGDGRDRVLRYTLRSFQLMSERGLNRGGRTFGSQLPELIWIGLHDAAGNPPEDVTLEALQALGVEWTAYLKECYDLAYTDAIGEAEKKLNAAKAGA